ncbi:hypothetical protein [Paenarthrobacter sp. JL.01a]|nr:hypothetical protein [Paenarthrobacter sp. JL.01a]UXM92860.1 hypothetical protein N5P29_05925 [Paenarthrobacter sp. JL.01a]
MTIRVDAPSNLANATATIQSAIVHEERTTALPINARGPEPHGHLSLGMP